MRLSKQQFQKRRQIAIAYGKFLQAQGIVDTFFNDPRPQYQHCSECNQHNHIMHITQGDVPVCPDCMDQRSREWISAYEG